MKSVTSVNFMTSAYDKKSQESILHIPVMVKECMDILRVWDGKFFLDATAGCGGHSAEILNLIGEDGVLVCNDWDRNSLKIAKERLLRSKKNVIFTEENFSEIDKICEKAHIQYFDGVLLDLGISSLQLDEPSRGFSFRFNSPLDMRMSDMLKVTAQELVNKLPERELARIIRNYGEENLAQKIAKIIVRKRKEKEIENCLELAEIVASVKGKKGKIHPATKTFQALRIAVNRELENLKAFLDKFPAFAKNGTRIAIISYHSLEDRIVKRAFKNWEREKLGKILTKHPIKPSREEIEFNPRARSAKLRGFIFSGGKNAS